MQTNEMQIPQFLYGTAWKEDTTQQCVSAALTAGFRGIDTANQRKHYHEAGVGSALVEAYATGTISRADLFIQTKFTHLGGQDQRLPYDPKADMHTQVMQSFASSLDNILTDYLDSYVLHGPSTRPGLADEDWEVWRAMEELQQSGKTRLIGVSNITINQLRELCDGATVKPHFVQNRCYASRGWDRDVRTYCVEKGITYQGFSLLTANLDAIRDRQFQEIVTRYGCTPAQLVFAFALHVGMLPLTGTTDPAHMNEDLASTTIALNAVDAAIIETIAG